MEILVSVQDQDCVDCFSRQLVKHPCFLDSEVRILHIVQPVQVNSYMSFLPGQLTEGIIAERHRKGQGYVCDLKSRLEESGRVAKVDTQVEEGSASMEIMDVIEGFEPDLVVLGSHGKTGLRNLGSVSQAVAGRAPCTVLVIPIRPEKKDTR